MSFALIWFSVFLMPALMVLSSASLVTLFVLDRELSIDVFRSLWALNLVTYLFVTLSAFAHDGAGGAAQLVGGDHVPGPDQPRDHRLPRSSSRCSTRCRTGCCCSPTCGCRPRCSPPISSGGSRRCRVAGWLARPLLYVVGYGPLLCAITAAAYLAELRRAEMAWEKTEKTGAVGDLA